MSKKKNTLKDLDEFLKQQAASIVAPAKLSEKVDAQEVRLQQESSGNSLNLDSIDHQLKALTEINGKPYRENLYDFVIHSLESLDQSLPEDKMLINTALYLKSGDRWKDVIRQYWRAKR